MSLRAFTNARLIDPKSEMDKHGSVLIENEKIKDLGSNISIPEGAEVVDCEGNILCPGLIDMQSHWADGKSAAKGGITTSVLFPDYAPPIDSNINVEYVLQKTQATQPINFQVLGAATDGLNGLTMAELGLMDNSGALGFTDGRKAIKNSSLMRSVLEYARGRDLLIVQHIEEPELVNDGVATEGELATRMGLPSIPIEAEVMMLERDLRLLELTPTRYHASQITTLKSLEAIRASKLKNKQITCGTSPQYFALNEIAITDYKTFAKVSPPLRSEDERMAVVEGIKDGTIDAITSCHDPQNEDLKRLPFEQAAPGIVGYETLLPLALELYHSAGIPLLTILKAMTSNPAEILGLNSGQLQKGAPADLLIFNLNSPWRIKINEFLSDNSNSPFDNRPVQGKVIETVVGGKTVYSRRKE